MLLRQLSSAFWRTTLCVDAFSGDYPNVVPNFVGNEFAMVVFCAKLLVAVGLGADAKLFLYSFSPILFTFRLASI